MRDTRKKLNFGTKHTQKQKHVFKNSWVDMHFLSPCPAAKRNNSQIQEAVKCTVKALMNKGVAHRDLKWNNFGFRQENNHIVAIAYDFGMAENITAENKVALVNEADEQVKQMFLNK